MHNYFTVNVVQYVWTMQLDKCVLHTYLGNKTWKIIGNHIEIWLNSIQIVFCRITLMDVVEFKKKKRKRTRMEGNQSSGTKAQIAKR